MSEFNKDLTLKDILLIEDELELRDLLENILRKAGFSVVTSDSLDGAISKMLSNRFSLVISDINLSGGSSGLDVLTWIKRNSPISRVILITGNLEDTDIHDALEIGVFGFLAKPIAKKELIKIVKNALSNDPNDKITDKDYARIDIGDFLTGKILNFPVYIRLKDSRFLKVAHSGTEIDLPRLNGLKERGIKELWIDQDDLGSYIKLNEKILFAKNTWNPIIKVKLLNHLSEICYESMRLLKITDSTIQQSVDSISLLINTLSQENINFTLISPYLDNDNRVSKMATLGACYSLLVAKVLEWNSEKTLYALGVGAFFRDIALLNANFDYEDFFRKSPNLDRELYYNHPSLGMDFLTEKGNFPSQALTIVAQHHEDGSPDAFPEKIPRQKVFAPALVVNYVDKMLYYMIQNSNKEPETIAKNIVTYLEVNLPRGDEKALALIALMRRGDIEGAKKELSRIKKLGG